MKLFGEPDSIGTCTLNHQVFRMEDRTHQSLLYLSDKRSLYLGRLGDSLSQCNAAGALLFSLDGTLSVTDQATQLTYESRSFLLPVGCRAKIHIEDKPIAVIFLEPLGRDLARLATKMSQHVVSEGKSVLYSGMANEGKIIASARKLLKSDASAETAIEALGQWIGTDEDHDNLVADKRVVQAIRIVKDTYSENISVEEIARRVELSVPRLIQLFKQVTGIPIRRYRMWYRIYMTAIRASEGLPLTEAAIAAGFSDYSQFSRTFKDIGGVNPSDVLSARDLVSIRVLGATNSSAQRTQESSVHSCECA